MQQDKAQMLLVLQVTQGHSRARIATEGLGSLKPGVTWGVPWKGGSLEQLQTFADTWQESQVFAESFCLFCFVCCLFDLRYYFFVFV